jgi:hypothetical protein
LYSSAWFSTDLLYGFSTLSARGAETYGRYSNNPSQLGGAIGREALARSAAISMVVFPVLVVGVLAVVDAAVPSLTSRMAESSHAEANARDRPSDALLVDTTAEANISSERQQY